MTAEGKYLASDKAGEMKLSDKPSFLTISVENGKATLSYGDTVGKIMYNNSSAWFTTYTSSNMIMPEIYVIHGDGTTPDYQPVLESIEVTARPTKTVYDLGEELVPAGLEVTGTYSDYSTKALASTEYTVSELDSATVGEKTITVTAGEKTATFTVRVIDATVPPEIESIAVTTQPTKTTYEVGEQLDTTGLVVTATYNNETTEVITDYTLSAFDSSTAGTKTITVTYGEFTTTFTVTVNTPTVTSITVSGPTKTTYEKGETLDTAGLVVTAHYSDGSEAVITSGYQLSAFDSSSKGEKTITVIYEGQSATFTVTVNDTLGDSKAAAIAELQTAYDNLDKAKYDETGLAALESALEAGKTAINGATSVDAVNSELTNAKDALNGIPTKPVGRTRRCGGDIAATSIILSTLALAGVGLLVFKKRKGD